MAGSHSSRTAPVRPNSGSPPPAAKAPARLTQFGGPYVQQPRWSPDGRRLVFAAPADGNFDVFSVGADGGPVTRLVDGPSRDRTPSFGPKGRRLFYASDASGRFAVWQLDIDSGRRTELFEGYAPRAIDGWLYFTKARANGLFRRPIDGGPEENIVPELTPVDAHNWVLLDGRIVFVERPIPAKPRLVSHDLATARRRMLTELPWFYHQSGLAVAPDGRLWMARVTASESDLYRISTASW